MSRRSRPGPRGFFHHANGTAAGSGQLRTVLILAYAPAMNAIRRAKKRRRLVATALGATMVLSACGADDAKDSGAGSGTEASTKMRVAVAFAPKAGFAIESNDAFVLANLGVLETLVRTDFDGKAQPGLAVSWEQVDDRSWRFRLRPGVSFHNGEEVNASAVSGALGYVFRSATPPKGLTGATTEAADNMTVVVRAAQPDPVLPLRLSSPSTGVLAPAAYGQGGPPRPAGTGTGPFELVGEVASGGVRLRANSRYWAGKPALVEVDVRFMPDPATRAAAIRAGELDLAQGIPAAQLPALRGAPGIKLVTTAEPRTTTLYTNTKSEKLADRRVREALALAIDRKLLAEGALDGSAVPAAGLFRPDAEWSRNRLKPAAADTAKATQLLAEAGYQKGQLKVSLRTYTDRAGLDQVATAVQAMLAQVGVDASVEVSKYATLEPDVLAGRFDLFLLSRSYLTDTNDPGGFLASDYGCKGGYNLNQFCDPEVDALIAQLQTISEKERRFDVIRRAEDRIVGQFAGIPLVHDQVTTAVRETVTGYRADPLGRTLLTPELNVKP